MSQPILNLALPLDVLNAVLQGLQAQQQAIGNSIVMIQTQAQAQVEAAKAAETEAAEKLVKAAADKVKADKKAAKTQPAADPAAGAGGDALS